MGVISHLEASWRARRDPEARRARKLEKAQLEANIASARARGDAVGGSGG
jgi:hypothetical protein